MGPPTGDPLSQGKQLNPWRLTKFALVHVTHVARQDIWLGIVLADSLVMSNVCYVEVIDIPRNTAVEITVIVDM